MTRDRHVRVLPLHVANKIAAGEVVERPASVLKELVENSIDADATRIEMAVTAGGRKLVSVRDNGCGMSREDAILSLERQATSKIRDVDDIERIDTLGFRGEAIPSIASVSRFTLVTRPASDESGTRISVNAGTLAEVSECGAPPGTCVEVRDLFCNVPARRKFLRAFATEEMHLRSVFTALSLAHPDVGFSMTLDGREAYSLPPGATLEERIRDLFGAPFAESLLPVSGTKADVRVHGYVERPDRSIGMKRDQFIFVNGRPASAPAISYALREAYPRAQGDTRPAMVLFIDLPPSQVDVNVHPSKREVRFRRAADVREAIIVAISEAIRPSKAASAEPAEPCPSAASDTPFVAPFSSPVQQAFVLPATAPQADKEVPPSAQGGNTVPEREPSTSQPLWTDFRYLAQTESGYLLIETDSGLVTIDPRAAWERIAYERLEDRNESLSQPLLIPETVTLPPADSARIKAFVTDMECLGFVMEEFGRDTWKIDAVPDIAAGMPAAGLIASMAADMAESGARRGGEKWRGEMVARSVAKSAAGSLPRFTDEAAIKLIESLARTRKPYTSPRGRPVMIFTSNRDLARKFGR